MCGVFAAVIAELGGRVWGVVSAQVRREMAGPARRAIAAQCAPQRRHLRPQPIQRPELTENSAYLHPTGLHQRGSPVTTLPFSLSGRYETNLHEVAEVLEKHHSSSGVAQRSDGGVRELRQVMCAIGAL